MYRLYRHPDGMSDSVRMAIHFFVNFDIFRWLYLACNWVYLHQTWGFCKAWSHALKDVRAHCYCASLVRTLFIGHARATSVSSARTESKTQQNVELMTFALTWCANIFVGRSVTPTFFSADHFFF